MHQLIITETRQSPANPNIGKEDEACLRREPENRHQVGLKKRNRENQSQAQGGETKNRKRDVVPLAANLTGLHKEHKAAAKANTPLGTQSE